MTKGYSHVAAALNIALLSGLSVSCAYHGFDEGRPEEYSEYWCEPGNYEESIAYQLSGDAEKRGYASECE